MMYAVNGTSTPSTPIFNSNTDNNNDDKTTNQNNNNTLLKPLLQTLGPNLVNYINNANILLVGAGGIGCELLKNLSLSGFTKITVIDLDTIDISNLNRQFLFRKKHVGEGKCIVACRVAEKMSLYSNENDDDDDDDDDKSSNNNNNTNIEYKPIHGNVCNSKKFDVKFLDQFSVVLNALDNVTARRRVNRLCLASNTPLIEAGTTGYLGQCTVIAATVASEEKKEEATECYECQTKPTQKVYPICTVRSTPSLPVHCIVWAKELYGLLFGEKVEESMLFEDEDALKDDDETKKEDSDDVLNKENDMDAFIESNGLKEQDDDSTMMDKTESKMMNSNDGESGSGGSTYMNHVRKLRSLLCIVQQEKNNGHVDDDEQQKQKCIEHLLIGIFHDEIQLQINMNRYKTSLSTPVPIGKDVIRATCHSPSPAAVGIVKRQDQNEIWSIEQCLSTIVQIILSSTTSKASPTFDKDDTQAMSFVTASTNLRQRIFAITPTQSLYGAKGIAGNIVPAIATTNAIVAGLQILQMFHVLRIQMETKLRMKEEKEKEGGERNSSSRNTIRDSCRYTYCRRDPDRRGFYVQPTTLPPPNPQCYVCRKGSAKIHLTIDVHNWTLRTLINRLLKQELGFECPTIMVLGSGDDDDYDNGGSIVHEEGEGADEACYAINLDKILSELPVPIRSGVVFTVEDFTQDLEVDVTVTHKDIWRKKKEGVVVNSGNSGIGVTAREGKEGEDDLEVDVNERFEIGGEIPKSIPITSSSNGNSVDSLAVAAVENDDDDDDIEILDEEDVATALIMTSTSKPKEISTEVCYSDETRKRKAPQQTTITATTTKMDSVEVVESCAVISRDDEKEEGITVLPPTKRVKQNDENDDGRDGKSDKGKGKANTGNDSVIVIELD